MNKIKSPIAFLSKSFSGFILLLIFTFLSNAGYSATYYISASTGNDDYTSSQARDQKTPWKSIEKLNGFFKYLKAGDSVLFKRGEIYYGSIVPSKSGYVLAPIYFGAYGTGIKPEVTGLVTLSSWKEVKKGIFETPCNVAGTDLLINNRPQQIGRYPNAGYLTIDSHAGNGTITDNQLASGPNWSGAEIVIRKTRWIIDRSAIISHNRNTLTFEGNSNTPKNKYGYFIQNNINTLDKLGEWYFDKQKKTMCVYFGSYKPSAVIVKTSSVANLVDIRRSNYITFEDISFTGSGKNSFNIIQAKGITIKNCSMVNSGAEAILASYSPFLSVQDCLINNSLSGGINLDAGCINASISNNTIKNTGLMAGMGKSGTGTYEAITSFGDHTVIEKNRIDSVGYNGIYFGGNSASAKNNYITYFCLTKDDGAGIYLGDWSKTTNKRVEGNIILHGIGNSSGTDRVNSLQAEGIYIDDNTESVNILDNTVSLCANNGIKLHNAKDINIYGNTVFNNGVQLRLEQDHYLASSKYIRNNNIKKNTFFSVNTRQTAAKFSTNQDDITSFGRIDSNIYCAPKNTDFVRTKKLTASNYAGAGDTEIRFEFNASNEAKIIKLSSSYVDVQNNRYSKTVTLSPYSSVILIASDPGTINNFPMIEYSAVINKTYEK
ncbi:right-handed parallel beta-helix repeat-containing protein [Mucilaginibacter aquariorum]|uniref:Right-handed parallel beta-helix repeat-containing protein n=1 Tax=Mucilaginibacter aquariorum TaxID=2967225 RepID=A0ABT1SVF3_9SPHI|nr:right-handed parallel beta-helix repeat-containing protein [Mucilaginibacter aquariorum]MCQ6956328.1 right-handed parallel beta-helix repeat-containing protein [Mucilaginibacter aquariorum]